jgi:hypothetical protein
MNLAKTLDGSIIQHLQSVKAQIKSHIKASPIINKVIIIRIPLRCYDIGHVEVVRTDVFHLKVLTRRPRIVANARRNPEHSE